MSLPPHGTVIDLRPDATRAAQPLPADWPVLPLTLDAIEAGEHGLNATQGPLLIVCERGPRAALAARYLRADGLDAQALPGGAAALPAR